VELSPDKIAAVDEFRYRARMPSRAAAVRELLRRALVSVEEGRLTTLNEHGELPVLEWIAVSGLIQVHRGPRPQGAGAAPCAGLHCPCFPSMQTTTRPLARCIPSA
jgi:hypothetical protein